MSHYTLFFGASIKNDLGVPKPDSDYFIIEAPSTEQRASRIYLLQ